MASYTSSGSGNWSSASTWGGAGVPTDGDSVTIGSGHVVTYDANIVGTGLAALTITGELTWSTDGTARTLTMASNANITGAGTLTVGTDAAPIPAPSTSTPEVASIVFQGTGCIAMTGTIRMRGEQRDGRDAATSDRLSTDNYIDVANASGWSPRAGDVIVLGRASAGTNCTLHTIQSVSGNRITLTSTLGRAVTIGDPVGLLSRNIALIGANTSGTRTFGSGSAASITVSGVEFRNWQAVLYNYHNGSNAVKPITYCTARSTSSYNVFWTCVGMTVDRCMFYRMTLGSGYSHVLRRSMVFYAGLAGTGNISQGIVIANATAGASMPSGQFSRCLFYYCSDAIYGVAGDCEFDECTFTGSTRDVRQPGISASYTLAGLIQLRNCVLGGATECQNYVNGNNAPDWCLMSRDHDGVAGALRSYSAGGTAYRQSTVQRAGRDTIQFIAESPVFTNRMTWERTVEAGETLTIDVWCSALDEWDGAPTAYLVHSTQEPIVDDECTPLAVDVVDEFYSGSGERTWHHGQLSWANTGTDAVQVLLILAGRDASATCYWDWDIQTASGGGGVAFPLGL